MATNAPNNSTFRLTENIRFAEIPTITLRYSTNDDDSDDGPSAPYTNSPLDEYRGTGSLSLRRIRSLGASEPPRGGGGAVSEGFDFTYANDRARSILREARDAINRILGVGNPIAPELTRLLGTI